MKIRRLNTVVLLFVAVVFYTCVKKPTYPDAPVITYQNFIRYGKNASNPDSAKLVITFTDNEGDIGLDQSDTTGPLFGNGKGNVCMVYFFDSTGKNNWLPYDVNPQTPQIDSQIVYFRVPLVLKDGEKAQPMKGLIFCRLDQPLSPFYKKFRYDVYMYDKAGNKSNRITTPAIILP